MKAKIIIPLFLVVGTLLSCNLVESIISPKKLGGTQSTIGATDNTFSFSGITGASGFTSKVESLENGVTSISASTTLTDSKIIQMAKSLPDLTWDGNKVSVTRKYHITSQGIQNVYGDEYFTLVKYDDSVGDSYSAKVNGNTVTRTITSKSTADDYPYGFYNIKVMKVEETGRGIPGVSKIEYFTNHKFGLVAVNVIFEDGSSKKITVYSKNEN